MSRPPTIIDVAALAGVSKSLVSMVLRGDPGVSETRRDAVVRAARELGYRPNRAAAILAGHRTRTIGLVIDDFRNPWYVPLLDGAGRVLAPRGLQMTVADGASNRHIGSDPFEDLVALRVDGIIMAGEARAGTVMPDGLPVVVAGLRSSTLPGADIVATDEQRSGRVATEHLLALGHTDVAHLTGAGGAGDARRSGYTGAMRDAQRRAIVFGHGGTTEMDGYRAASEMFRAEPAVTAVFASNDVMAMGALAAAHENGLRVPEDVSVIGCDDSPLASSPLLQLSSVDARSADVGRRAAEVLVLRIDGVRSDDPERVVLQPTLVERRTTRPRST